MILHLNDKWRIASDPHSWMVQQYLGERKNRDTGESEPRWESVEWHPTFQKAVASLSERGQREISAETVESITRELQALSADVRRLAAAFEAASRS